MFVFLCALAGLALMGLGLWIRAKGLASVNWPGTDGTITVSRVDDSDNENLRPDIVYTYTVSGKERRGTRIAYSGYSVSRSNIEAMVAKYPAQSPVKVYYNPQAPEQSVLENQPSQDWAFWACFGIGFLALAVYLSRLP